jgi:tetratricopeptide (TPR) repeat protein
MGDPARARPLAERALAIDETSYGPEHPKVATSRNNLALILKDLGDPTEARKLMERALAIDEVAYGPNHPKVATRRNNLAMILQDLGIKPKGDR